MKKEEDSVSFLLLKLGKRKMKSVEGEGEFHQPER